MLLPLVTLAAAPVQLSGPACIAQIEDEPDVVRDAVMARLKHLGGDAGLRNGMAECLARADAALNLWGEAAPLFDALSQKAAAKGGDPRAAASLAREAADAWRADNQNAAACASAARGLKLAPDEPLMRLSHARASLACDAPAAALADLSTGMTLTEEQQTQALVLRAQALRQTGKPEDAEAAASAALERTPDMPAALLERGLDRARTGKLRLARQDWERVVVTAPDSPESNHAQQDLDVLAADPDRTDAAE